MAVALLNTNTMGQTPSSPVSAAMTVNAGGTNVCAFAIIAYDNTAGQAVSSVTYGGQAMTSCGTRALNTTPHANVEVYYLLNPPTGSNTLAITMSGTFGGSNDIYYNLVVFQGVNQVTPVRAGTYQHLDTAVTDGTSHVSITISSNTNDLTLAAINTGGASIGTGNSFTNQTGDGSNSNGSYGAGSDHATTAASSVTHTYLLGAASQQCAFLGFSINGDQSTQTLGQARPPQRTNRLGMPGLSSPKAFVPGATPSPSFQTQSLSLSAGNARGPLANKFIRSPRAYFVPGTVNPIALSASAASGASQTALGSFTRDLRSAGRTGLIASAAAGVVRDLRGRSAEGLTGKAAAGVIRDLRAAGATGLTAKAAAGVLRQLLAKGATGVTAAALLSIVRGLVQLVATGGAAGRGTASAGALRALAATEACGAIGKASPAAIRGLKASGVAGPRAAAALQVLRDLRARGIAGSGGAISQAQPAIVAAVLELFPVFAAALEAEGVVDAELAALTILTAALETDPAYDATLAGLPALEAALTIRPEPES